VKSINREYDEKRKLLRANQAISDVDREKELQSLQDAEDEALDVVREGAAKQAKERQRAARDAQQKVLDQLNEKRAAEEKVVKDGADKQKQIVKDGADKQIETLKKLAEESIKALSVDPAQNAMEQQMEELGLSGKAASEAFQKLGVTIKNQDGTLRGSDAVLLDIANKFKTMTNPVEKTALAMKLFGRSGAELVPLLSKGGDAIEELKVKMTTAFAEDAKKYTIELTKLNGKIGAIGGSIAIVLTCVRTRHVSAEARVKHGRTRHHQQQHANKLLCRFRIQVVPCDDGVHGEDRAYHAQVECSPLRIERKNQVQCDA
jgi:hypothetical protein